ncbi:TPA: hypothetical protein N2D99_001999 [Clostridium botulinum]|nr:hypothetical protein [Clostridium botulinum]
MKINREVSDVKKILEAYISGLIVPRKFNNNMITWYFEIQRIVENELISYDKEDIDTKSFLYPLIVLVDNQVEITLLKEGVEKILIKIPFIEKKDLIELTKKIEIEIK